MSELAKDVAKELERRRFRRRIVMLSAWAGAIILAVLYLRCGRGWGTGGEGGGGSDRGSAASSATKKRCQIRLDGKGLTVDGHSASRDTATELCKAAGGAEVVVTGAAREGDWAMLRGMLSAAHVDIVLHEPKQGH
jgi:hypothetical protein